jgi:hypothetical protein
MPVFLSTSSVQPSRDCTFYCTIDSHRHFDINTVPDLAGNLEKAFDAIRPEWAKVAKELGHNPSAILAHMPACAANASDFGLMLAWSKLIGDWGRENTSIHVVCDDPWLFRHLREIPGVKSERPPLLWAKSLKFFLRGYGARMRAMVRHVFARLSLPRPSVTGGAVLLVYGHPDSTADGADAYFGDLINRIGNLTRVLHIDCRRSRANGLASPTTSALHAWGPAGKLFKLPFAKWRPNKQHLKGPYGWLIRRAAAHEGGTGQGAMIAWQLACQESWLAGATPKVVAWPWENHSWERAFVRSAHALGIHTVGYQHTVVGNREWNYLPDSNPDGIDSLPAQILTSGAESADTLKNAGIPADRIEVGGALRATTIDVLPHDPEGPVFVALPFDHAIAAQMIDAIGKLKGSDRRFIVKSHPMTPSQFRESEIIEKTNLPLNQQTGVSGVIYAATTVGLEALLGGLPTLRFRPSGKVPTDVIPTTLNVASADSTELESAFRSLTSPPSIKPDRFFAKPDYPLWEATLHSGTTATS